MSASAGDHSSAEWFLARDGEQFGPLSGTELRKLIDLGHLRATDLLWREGFPEWRSARILLPDSSAEIAGDGDADHDDVNPVGASPKSAAAPVKAPEPVAQPAPPVQAAAAQASVAQAPVAQAPAVQASPQAHSVRVQPVQIPAQTQAAQPQTYAPAPSAVVSQAAAVQSARVPSPHTGPNSGPNSGAAAPNYTPQPQQRSYQPAPAAPVAAALDGPHGNAAPSPGQWAPNAPQQYADRPRQPSVSQQSRPVPTPADASAPQPRTKSKNKPARRPSKVGLWLKRTAVLVFFASTLSAAIWYAYPHRARILSMASAVTTSLGGEAKFSAPPLTGFVASAEANDTALQKAQVWRTLKRTFPDWYAARIKEASDMAGQSKPDAEIGQHLLQAIVSLRRQHAGHALSAGGPRLKEVAATFADSLGRMRGVSVDACFGYISNGELSPGYLKMINDPAHTAALQGQVSAVFDAIANGRTTPRIHPQPKQADYDQLVTVLEGRGWKETDLQLFSDSRALGRASPEKVCQLVTDWFQGQLTITDPDALERLLADALKPVVAG